MDFLKDIFTLNLYFSDSFKIAVKQGFGEKKIVESVSKIDFNGVKSLQKRSLFDLHCITLENFIQIVKYFVKTSKNFSQFSELFKILTFTDNKFKGLPELYKKKVIMVLLNKYYNEVKKSKTIEDISIDMFDKFLVIIGWINSEKNIREDMYKLMEILRNNNLSIDCLILLYEFYYNIPEEKKNKYQIISSHCEVDINKKLSQIKNGKLMETRRLIDIILNNQNVNYDNKGQISLIILILKKLYKNPITEEQFFITSLSEEETLIIDLEKSNLLKNPIKTKVHFIRESFKTFSEIVTKINDSRISISKLRIFKDFMEHKVFTEKMKLLCLENNNDDLKKNIIKKIQEIKKISNDLLEMDNYKTNFFDDCNIEELMNSRERILKLLKKGDELLHSHIIDENFKIKLEFF